MRFLVSSEISEMSLTHNSVFICVVNCQLWNKVIRANSQVTFDVIYPQYQGKSFTSFLSLKYEHEQGKNTLNYV